MAQVVGQNVREVRSGRLSQAELAESVAPFGITWTQPTVAQLEAGKRPTTINEVWALALALGVRMDTLLSPPDDAVLIAGEHETVPGYGPGQIAVSGAMASVERLYETAFARLDKAAGKDDAQEAKDALRHARIALMLLEAIEGQVSAFREDLAARSDILESLMQEDES